MINFYLPKVGICKNGTSGADGVDGAKYLDIGTTSINRMDGVDVLNKADRADRVKHPNIGIASVDKIDRAEGPNKAEDSNKSIVSIDKTGGTKSSNTGTIKADLEEN